jgi:hypothetical protein
MGLDMYLSKKTYVKQWSHQKPEDQFEVSVKRGGVTYPFVKTERVSYITEEVAYWRKANQIHGWFCNNCEEVVADVKYYVTKENLEELLKACKTVLETLNKIPKVKKEVVGGWRDGKEYMVEVEGYDNTDEVLELLPPTPGFFFGSLEIDEYYKEEIEDTIKVLEDELSTEGSDYPEYEYYASW